MATVKRRTWKGAKGKERSAWRVSFSDSNGVRKRKQFSKKEDADRFRIRVEGQIQAGTFRMAADKISVRELIDLYLQDMDARLARSEITRRHVEMVRGRVENYLCPGSRKPRKSKRGSKQAKPFSNGIGALKLAHLTEPRVKQFGNDLRDAGLSVPLTRKVIATLRAALAFAISEHLIATNAASRVKIKGKRGEGSKKIVAPAKDAVRRLIEVADADFKLELMFAATTGVRAGEQHALRWKHVNLDEAEVKIETRVDSHGDEDAPKTKTSVRTIPLGSEMVRQLREWKVRSKFSKDSDLVFPGRKGRYKAHSHLLQDQFYPLFVALAEQHEADPANVAPAPARFRWHDLRHFAISTWIEAGLQPKVVQGLAGHSSLTTTMDTYGHWFKSDTHRHAMDAISRELF